uniref:SFRICE_018476 n=1 Tax=Spodoptera frugiperda TaxID=7108 RepID=A0A2H1WP78_SPOFR
MDKYSLTFYYQNCRGLRTKLHTLFMNILSFSYDVIVLTETWLIPDISDSEYIDDRYLVFRSDRDRSATEKRDGGGVLIAILRSLRPTNFFTHLARTDFEHVLVQLPASHPTKRHIISAAYIPPRSPGDLYSSHFDMLQDIFSDVSTDTFYVIVHRKRFKSESVKCFEKYIKTVEDSIPLNIKHFWTYVSNRKGRAVIPANMYLDDVHSSDPIEIIYEPSNFDPTVWQPPNVFADNASIFSDIYLSKDVVLKAIKKLDLNKGPGPDSLPPIFLKKTAECIVCPLHIIFNKCLRDCQLLQEDLDRLSRYCWNNKLQLSLPKCNAITFTKNKNIITYDYKLDDMILKKVNNIRDLGVTIDSKLHFDVHIDNIVNKAYRMFGFVLRSSNDFKRPSTFLLLYKALVRSQLEYAVPIWSPIFDVYKTKIEMVQKKFLRATHYRTAHSKLPYKQLLKRYNLQSLESRRSLLMTMMLHGLCNNKFDCPEITNNICYIVPRTVMRREARVPQLFHTARCRTHAGARAPLRRMVDTYNSHYITLDIFALPNFKFKRMATEILYP